MRGSYGSSSLLSISALEIEGHLGGGASLVVVLTEPGALNESCFGGGVGQGNGRAVPTPLL